MDVKFINTGLSTLFYASDGISFLDLRFENDVKMYGTQTRHSTEMDISLFENDVKMYGTQTGAARGLFRISLRMM